MRNIDVTVVFLFQWRSAICVVIRVVDQAQTLNRGCKLFLFWCAKKFQTAYLNRRLWNITGNSQNKLDHIVISQFQPFYSSIVQLKGIIIFIINLIDHLCLSIYEYGNWYNTTCLPLVYYLMKISVLIWRRNLIKNGKTGRRLNR